MKHLIPTFSSLFLLLVVSTDLRAQAPDSISVQGVLTESGGTPVADASYSITFTLYDTLGVSIWTETQSVPTLDGVYQTTLGRVTTLADVPFTQQLELGIKVEADPEMTPRTSLASSPYALSLRNLRVEPETATDGPALIGGWTGNSASGVAGATISGGGSSEDPNEVSGIYGTVGGGFCNSALDNATTIGGGAENAADGNYATIAGGQLNSTNSSYATIGGGRDNSAGGSYATISGGFGIIANGNWATVIGGNGGLANGDFSVVAGGQNNGAYAERSFVAGIGAIASHPGSWVWADPSDNNSFQTTAANQFLIRAAGGVGIGTNAPGSQLTVAGVIESTVGGIKFPDGTLQTTAGGGGGGAAWGLAGNSGTTAGTNYLGTSDDEPFEIRVNGDRVVRFELETSLEGPNIIGGWSGNEVDTTTYMVGATIAGGGGQDGANRITEAYGTIGGGLGNTAGSGSVVGGGTGNTASGLGSSIGGGSSNSASGLLSMVPGGWKNRANGSHSLAAGWNAKALHSGSFVWSDRSSTFESDSLFTTAQHQFLIRARGGVGIGTNAPGADLHVRGTEPVGSFDGQLWLQGTATDGAEGTGGGLSFAGNDGTTDRVWGYVRGIKDNSSVGNETSRMAFGTRSVAGNVLDRAYIDGSGNFTPGANDTYSLGTSGLQWSSVWAASGTVSSSDRRLKSNIRDLGYGIDEVRNLRPVSFTWRDKESGGHHLGLIAQEVADVVSEVVVHPDEETGTLGVRYSQLIPVLIKAIQEQQELIDHLEESHANLRQELARISEEMMGTN